MAGELFARRTVSVFNCAASVHMVKFYVNDIVSRARTDKSAYCQYSQ